MALVLFLRPSRRIVLWPRDGSRRRTRHGSDEPRGESVEQFHTNWYPQRVRIVALPPDRRLEGFDLSTFEVGQWYRVGERLAELLIVSDYGELEGEDSVPIH